MVQWEDVRMIELDPMSRRGGEVVMKKKRTFPIEGVSESEQLAGKYSLGAWISLRPRMLYFCWSCSLLQVNDVARTSAPKICIVSKGSNFWE